MSVLEIIFTIVVLWVELTVLVILNQDGTGVP